MIKQPFSRFDATDRKKRSMNRRLFDIEIHAQKLRNTEKIPAALSRARGEVLRICPKNLCGKNEEPNAVVISQNPLISRCISESEGPVCLSVAALFRKTLSTQPSNCKDLLSALFSLLVYVDSQV